MLDNVKCEFCMFYFSKCDMPNCRRFPPVHNDDLHFGVFPAVHKDDWCGEFKDAGCIHSVVDSVGECANCGEILKVWKSNNAE